MYELIVLDKNGVRVTGENKKVKSFACRLDVYGGYNLLITELNSRTYRYSGVVGFVCENNFVVIKTSKYTLIFIKGG